MVLFYFFRIEEEDLDKYNIPAKVESEKYKVIRTFSFLKSRMSSTRNKTKVNLQHASSAAPVRQKKKSQGNLKNCLKPWPLSRLINSTVNVRQGVLRSFFFFF